MKKPFLISIFLFFSFMTVKTFGQLLPTYPIPSMDVQVNSFADFKETCLPLVLNRSKSKKVIQVQVKTVQGSEGCQATIWVYRLDLSTMLGPYRVDCGDVLSVPIDDGYWGVLVDSDCEVSVSVWIDDDGSK